MAEPIYHEITACVEIALPTCRGQRIVWVPDIPVRLGFIGVDHLDVVAVILADGSEHQIGADDAGDPVLMAILEAGKLEAKSDWVRDRLREKEADCYADLPPPSRPVFGAWNGRNI